jgi:hypothetical protein
MSRRVLVKGDIGQGVGRAAGAVSGAARGAALGSIVPGVGTVLGGIAGAVLGGKAGGKVGDALTGGENITEANNQQSFTDKIKARGKAAADAGAAYAQANQQAQQRMEERGQAMADKAKAGSQIATGEAMDMSWRLLKDVYFGQEFQNPQYAQARQQIIDAAIENMQNNPFKQPNQHGKIGAGMVEDIPEEYYRGEIQGKKHYADSRGDISTVRFPSDYMYDQEHSDPKRFPGMHNIPAHQLLNALGGFVDYSNLPNWKGQTSVRAALPNLIERRKSGSHSKQLTGYTPLLEEMASPALVTTLTDKMNEAKGGARRVLPHEIMQPNLERGQSMLARTQEVNRERREKEQAQKDARAKQLEEEREAKEEEERAAGREKADKAIAAQKQTSKDKAQATREQTKQQNVEANIRDIKLSAEQTKQEREGFLDTDEGKMMASRFSTIPGAGVHTFDNQMITNPTQMLSVFEMDMAWRMLKGELQLPHQITEALRGDLTTLDRAHKMTDTNEGTLIENIHPDMENVVKLLAEKHLGDLTPTMQRPVMPLFHSPFH